MSTSRVGAEKEEERTPSKLLSTQSPRWSSISWTLRSWPDLKWSQMLNRLSHPGTPLLFFFSQFLSVLSSQLDFKHIKGHAISIITFTLALTWHWAAPHMLYANHISNFHDCFISRFPYFPMLLDEQTEKQEVKLSQDHTQQSSRAGTWKQTF